MALRRYQHKFLQPLEIDQERVASSENTNLTTTNLTVTNSTVTNQTVSKLSTNNFFNSATPDYTPSSETLTVFGDPNVSTGSIATIRVNNVSVNDADAFGGLMLSSSQGNDFIIGKRSAFGTASLQIRNSIGNSLLTLAAGGQLAVTSVIASSYGSVGTFSGLFGQIRVGADQFGNTIKVVNDTNLNLVANNAIYFNVGASTAGTDTGTNVGSFGTNGLYFPSGKGIDFSATNNSSGVTASEIFDDYETGTWTPGITQGVLGSATGVYTKVGRLVTIQFQISNFTNTSSTAAVAVTGLPFSNSGSYCAGTIFGRFINSGTGGPYTAIYVSGSTCTFFNTSNGAYDNMIYTRINNGTSCEIYGIATYNAS